MRSYVLALLSIIMAILPGACTPRPTTEESATGAAALTHITLPVGYVADVQFTPFYVAVDKGFYRARGLDVDFHYRFEPDFVKLVGTNSLPFAIASGEQIVLARSQGLPVVYVMQWFRRFPIAVLSKESAGIATPLDLKGRRVGLPIFGGASFVGWRGLLWKTGLEPGELNEQNLGGFVQLPALQEGKVDAVVVYANNEPVQMELSGEPASVIYVSDYVNLVANGLVTNETLVRTEPELVRAMVAATLEGIRFTLDHPDEAFAIAQSFVPDLAKDAASLQRGRAVLDASLEMWRGAPLGITNPAAWLETQAVLLQMGEIDQAGDVTLMFSNEFVR